VAGRSSEIDNVARCPGEGRRRAIDDVDALGSMNFAPCPASRSNSSSGSDAWSPSTSGSRSAGSVPDSVVPSSTGAFWNLTIESMIQNWRTFIATGITPMTNITWTAFRPPVQERSHFPICVNHGKRLKAKTTIIFIRRRTTTYTVACCVHHLNDGGSP